MFPSSTHSDVVAGPAVEIRDLGKRFTLPGGRELVALESISLAILAGDFTCVVGPSGCGKSTLLGILAGLIKSDAGEVRTSCSRVAIVFQEHRLLPWRTIADNVRLPLRGVRKVQAAELVSNTLELVGLVGCGDRYPYQLSGGMQQRASIARALVTDPDLLLMDEPFSSLDEMTARRLRIELLALWERLRTTIVFVTHNPLEASYLADRLVIMQPARIVTTMDVTLERPRSYEDPELFSMYRMVINALEENKA